MISFIDILLCHTHSIHSFYWLLFSCLLWKKITIRSFMIDAIQMRSVCETIILYMKFLHFYFSKKKKLLKIQITKVEWRKLFSCFLFIAFHSWHLNYSSFHRVPLGVKKKPSSRLWKRISFPKLCANNKFA